MLQPSIGWIRRRRRLGVVPFLNVLPLNNIYHNPEMVGIDGDGICPSLWGSYFLLFSTPELTSVLYDFVICRRVSLFVLVFVVCILVVQRPGVHFLCLYIRLILHYESIKHLLFK